MSDTDKKEETIWVTCAACGHQNRKHRILHEKIKHYYDDPDGPPINKEFHRFVECMGCESVKYVASEIDLIDPDDDQEYDFKVYPDAPGTIQRRVATITEDEHIPESVWKMYKETIDALNADIRTLAGGGLRATVEAICIDSGIKNGNLQDKINELSNRNLLTRTQTELLHEERYLGNAALHELETPSSRDIEDGLGIVEGLINTIYILPKKAERLKKRREAKKQKQK